jgi:hypothetical protein
MEPEKYESLWENIILKAINDFISNNSSYELAVSEDVLKENIWNFYENKYKPLFKNEYMADDLEGADVVKINGEKEIKIDRHKVAALLYLSIVCNDSKTFMRVRNKPDQKSIFGMLACHRIAYNVSLNCITSFIEEFHRQNPNCKHKDKFLSNKGFSKSPDLICEKYAGGYKESVIPRILWATEEISTSFEDYTVSSDSVSMRTRRVATIANMLANIFYFLESHSAS